MIGGGGDVRRQIIAPLIYFNHSNRVDDLRPNSFKEVARLK